MKKLLFAFYLLTSFLVEAQTIKFSSGAGGTANIGDMFAAMRTRPPAILDCMAATGDYIVPVHLFIKFANDGYYLPLCVTSAQTNANFPPILEVITSFSRRRDLPFGVNKSGSLVAANAFSETYVNYMGTSILTNYTLVKSYLPYVPDSVALWRRSLAGATANSVDIIIPDGYLDTLVQVYESPADSISGSTGVSLLNTKVRRIIVRGFDINADGTQAAVGNILSASSRYVSAWNGITAPKHVVLDGQVTLGGGANLGDSASFYANAAWIGSRLSPLDSVAYSLKAYYSSGSGATTVSGTSLGTMIYATYGTDFYGTNLFYTATGTSTFQVPSGFVNHTFSLSLTGKDVLIYPQVTPDNWKYIGEQLLERYSANNGMIYKQGDIVAGNLSFKNGFTTEYRTTGTAPTAGIATLVAGSATVSTTAVKANSIILFTYATAGGTQGILRTGTITAGTSFVITSSSGTDTSNVQWVILQRDTVN